MKKFRHIFFVTVALIQISYAYAYGQDSTSHCSWKATAISVRSGMVFKAEYPFSISDMEKIAPGMSMLHQDFSGFETNRGLSSMMINGSSEFSSRIDIEHLSSSTAHHILTPTFHAGFNYADVVFSGANYYRNYIHRYDTVTSGNLTLYMDSVHFEGYNFQWRTKAASLDIGEDFHSNDKRIFSAGFGYGVLLGVGMNSQLGGSYQISDIIRATSSSGNSAYVNNMSERDSVATEYMHTGSSFFARVYFPMYVQFRLSRKDNFFNHLAFTMEGKTGIDLMTVPGLGVQSRPFYAQSFGFKFYFEKSPTRFGGTVTPAF